MPAVLKVTYSINPAVDLTNADESVAMSMLHEEFGPTAKTALINTITQLMQSGVTSYGLSVLDKDTRKLIFERQYTSAAAAEDRKSWLQTNLPSSTANFTVDSIDVVDNTELPPI